MDQEIKHTRGDTFIRNMTFADASGTPIDLTGSVIKFTVKKSYDDTEASVSSTAIVSEPTTGQARIVVAASTMRGLTSVDAYYYDIQWTDSTGVVKTVLKGKFLNTFDVT